ncbi:hypothetical protein AAG570_008538 [Ranatra chinensis]|uniref:Nudix hydrolase domain-containing protein n=1 Tax=Ranatra chinensis TaxID=642074 RepID=A0ABD0YRH5_9HEMI
MKCRDRYYPRTNGTVERLTVSDDKVSWKVLWDNYNPPDFTFEHIKKQAWADPEIGDSNFIPSWNKLDGNVDRRSHMGFYTFWGGYPQNPCGRTGLRGRGLLGRWGPNHAADPVVTRWKRGQDGHQITDKMTNKPLLQFIGIRRRDCGQWAIPGGMVDPGELVSTTLKREFLEEALNTLELDTEGQENIEKLLGDFFSWGAEIYKGYVDDPRNTDNAWIETVVYNFHDDKGVIVGSLPFSAGDDAISVKWLDVSNALNLYASHSDFIKLVALKHNAHW